MPISTDQAPIKHGRQIIYFSRGASKESLPLRSSYLRTAEDMRYNECMNGGTEGFRSEGSLRAVL